MKKLTPQEEGYLFEKTFGNALGIKPTKGSGNQWFAPMDLGNASVLISCKHTTAASFRVEQDHLREVASHCTDDTEPAMAVSVRGEVFIIQRAGDWVASRQRPAESSFIPASKSAIKRARTKTPLMLRDNPEEDE